MSAQLVLPQFTDIDIANFPKDLKNKLQAHLQQISVLLDSSNQFTWDNLMSPLEEMNAELEQFWAPLSHLHGVINSEPVRKCYKACLPLLSAHESAIGHNETLYQAIKSINTRGLDKTQHKIVDDTLLDFELSGVALSPDHKKRFEAIQTRLSDLSNQFENNILDSEDAFELHITDQTRLEGLPEDAIETARDMALEKKKEGWILSLQYPSYIAVMTYAEDRTLREEIYFAYATRASEQGPHAGKFDNGPLMDEILALRHEKSQLLGFSNYAELSLATKMAESTGQVIDFLLDLSTRARRQGEFEYKHLVDFAAEQCAIKEVQPWDISYLSEKKKQALYAFSREELRPYFPQSTTMEGMFLIMTKLFDIQFKEIKNVDTWHPDVKCYKVLDNNSSIRGYIYVDLYARPSKRGGAWMDALQSRRKCSDGSVQLPIATLNCNFSKPTSNNPAMLYHEDVLTLFHEFGHCLHHVLTRVDYLGASGIHGVEWDAVELPSQFFENWCWEQSALNLITSNVNTGQPLPIELYHKLLSTKNFHSAMGMLRQLEFSLFDFKLHQDYKPGETSFVQRTLDEIREQTSVTPVASYSRFPNSFGHVFSGGYAAGYYSYKWAEVFSSDAFSRFEEEGIFNPHTGRDFLHFILEVGGSVKAMDAYIGFRGRVATVDALLKHNGIM